MAKYDTMRYLMLSLFLSTTCIQTFSQRSYKIDSLLLTIQTGGESFENLYRLSVEFMYYKNDSGYYYSKKAFRIAEQLQDTLKIVDAGRVQANLLRAMEKSDSALLMIRKILPVARKHNFKRQLIYTTNVVAVIYVMRAQYDSALIYLFESLALRKEVGKREDIAACLANIGLAYYKMKLYAKALDYYEQSIRIAMSSKNPQSLDMIYVNKGMCLVYLKQYDKAINVIHKGMSIIENGDFGAPEISLKTKYMGLFGLGVAFYGKRSFESAELNFKESLKFATRNLDERLQADNLVYLAKIAATKHLDRTLAISYLKRAEELSLRHNYRELLLSIYKDFLNAYDNSPDKLEEYQRRYIAIRDSINHADFRNNLIMLEARLKKEDHKAVINSQAQIMRLNELLISKNKIMVWAISTVFFMAAILFAVLYRVSTFKKVANANIEKSIMLQTAALRKTLLSLQERQENKRVEQDNFLSELNKHLSTIEGLRHVMNFSSYSIKISNVTQVLRKLVVVETKQL